MSFKLIPGWTANYYGVYLVAGDDDGLWAWTTCLGVALSIAGALAAAYANGRNKGWQEAWEEGGLAEAYNLGWADAAEPYRPGG